MCIHTLFPAQHVWRNKNCVCVRSRFIASINTWSQKPHSNVQGCIKSHGVCGDPCNLNTFSLLASVCTGTFYRCSNCFCGLHGNFQRIRHTRKRTRVCVCVEEDVWSISKVSDVRACAFMCTQSSNMLLKCFCTDSAVHSFHWRMMTDATDPL